MTFLSQSPVSLSMLAPLAAATLVLAAPAAAGGAAASLYYGRWTVSDDQPVFTARGRLYKTIDVAPCGRDFCGVSVGDKGECGPLLFRFLAAHASAEMLRGHGRWGAEQKTVVIYSMTGSGDAKDAPSFDLYLGDGHEFGERSGNMPKFHAGYSRSGRAFCVSKA